MWAHCGAPSTTWRRAFGTALAGALVVGILSLNIQRGIVDNPAIPESLIQQVNLDSGHFRQQRSPGNRHGGHNSYP